MRLAIPSTVRVRLEEIHRAFCMRGVNSDASLIACWLLRSGSLKCIYTLRHLITPLVCVPDFLFATPSPHKHSKPSHLRQTVCVCTYILHGYINVYIQCLHTLINIYIYIYTVCIYIYIYICMVVSLHRGTQYRPQNATIPIMGTPKKGTPNFGTPPICCMHLLVCRPAEASTAQTSCTGIQPLLCGIHRIARQLEILNGA